SLPPLVPYDRPVDTGAPSPGANRADILPPPAPSSRYSKGRDESSTSYRKNATPPEGSDPALSADSSTATVPRSVTGTTVESASSKSTVPGPTTASFSGAFPSETTIV